MMHNVIVVGSANMDMVVKCRKLPARGETVLGDAFIMAGGGKGANQAVAAARLGAPTWFVARLGRDAQGRILAENYRQEGLHTDFISYSEDTASGVALIFVEASGENMIAVAPGANAKLSPADVAAAQLLFLPEALLLAQLEIDLATVRAAVERAKAAGMTVILNPAPAQPLPDELVAGVILTPNRGEAALLAGRPGATPSQAAETLLKRGAVAVVVTLGAEGALLVTPDGTLAVPSWPVQAVDATAAGDAFNGGLAFALARGDDLPAAVRFAAACGALAATKMGAQPSLPMLPAVEALLRRDGT